MTEPGEASTLEEVRDGPVGRLIRCPLWSLADKALKKELDPRAN